MKKKKKKTTFWKYFKNWIKKGEKKKSNSIPTNHATHIHLFKARFETFYSKKKCAKKKKKLEVKIKNFKFHINKTYNLCLNYILYSVKTC